jgi:hypothetical protein
MIGNSRKSFLGVLGTLLLAVPLLILSWAENRAESPTPAPPFVDGSEITLQLSYSCPGGTACSFVCPAGVGAGGAAALGGAGGAAALGRAGGATAVGGAGGAQGLFGADHVTKLTIYLGTMPLGNGQNAPVLFYDFSTRERPNSSGF